jgi:hypothetical protein
MIAMGNAVTAVIVVNGRVAGIPYKLFAQTDKIRAVRGKVFKKKLERKSVLEIQKRGKGSAKAPYC